VQVSETAAGTFAVAGAGGTTISGNTSFSGVSAVVALFGAGNDALQISSFVDLNNDGQDDGTLGGLTVNGGDGNNALSLDVPGSIQLGILSASGGDGQDLVTVGGGAGVASKISGNVKFNLGHGV